MKDRLWPRGKECLDIGATSDHRRVSDSSENMNQIGQSGKGPRAATLRMPLLEVRDAKRGPGSSGLASKLYVRV